MHAQGLYETLWQLAACMPHMAATKEKAAAEP
jgi:hypothetical protein